MTILSKSNMNKSSGRKSSAWGRAFLDASNTDEFIGKRVEWDNDSKWDDKSINLKSINDSRSPMNLKSKRVEAKASAPLFDDEGNLII